MARTIDHQYRRGIAQLAASYLLEQGRMDVSLREIAAAVGVSPRMLVHHFGSREELVSRALGEARSQQRAAFEALLAPQPGRPHAPPRPPPPRSLMPWLLLLGVLAAGGGAYYWLIVLGNLGRFTG